VQRSLYFEGPPGFEYVEDLLSPSEEQELLTNLEKLPFKEFEFHGYLGKRRVVSFGWKYDFAKATIREAAEIPPFLLPVREKAARLAELKAESLVQGLVTEYRAGTVIGWHRDKGVFGDVVGISLLSPCTFRFRRKAGTKWDRYSQTLLPRSGYVLRGEVRNEWEHSIPPVDELRYSITFRTLR
jgi:alkylated DNA repair dioxygenase AlkB